MRLTRLSPRLLSALVLLTLLAALKPAPLVTANHTPNPETVTIPGTLQSELGCSGDWQPECPETFLTYDAEDDVWQGTFDVGPNNDQDQNGPRYKAALNQSWSENYGQNAAQNGPDIPLVVAQSTAVTFYYDHKTHWVTDNINSVIAVAVGDFQRALGCGQDHDAGCLRSWLQDPDGDGSYAFTTQAIPAGTYTVQVALNEAADELVGTPTTFTVSEAGAEIYFGYNAETKELLVSTEGAPRGNLTLAQAHWVTRDTILWNIVGSPNYTYTLHYDPEGRLELGASGVEGGRSLALTFARGGPGGDVFQRFPHLAGYSAFKLAEADLAHVPEALKGQVAVSARDTNGRLVDVTALQIPGVLDDLYVYDGPLGVSWVDGRPTLRLWAPTAKAVALLLLTEAPNSDANAASVQPMSFDPQTGVWSITGQADWENQYYLYQVDVYVPGTGRVERNVVTDPYSLNLSLNSARSQLVDLNDPALMPEGWAEINKPTFEAPEDIVLYELHVRDFSANDASVPAELRGTFKAFTVLESNGMRHLRRLAEAGVTHVHLLPAFDFASVNEDKATWQTVDEARLATLPADSDEQQAAVSAIAGEDGFNWGYDPFHYTTPEGSYATEPNGPARIREFREMVQALNQIGLRVVMDVVYNHTTASGQAEKSVLDKIVPGYYHRLNAKGQVEKSTCCENTASEHRMMEKLMIDSVLTWATAYKVDGFRFDLMGHHMLANMVNVRAALDRLTPAQDGVDGRAIYVYGEGWNFGEVANNARGRNATQLNIGGTGLGVFNDRLRDGARGGGPFAPLPEQGFITGLWLEPNAYEQRPAEAQQARLMEYMDWIHLGLAGNLRDYTFADGPSGAQVGYNGVPAGYTLDPQENIVYVSAHDNETLFDAVQAKAPESASLSERIRMHNLGLSLVLLSQGVPFFHAGDELLRSKSLDRNSYNSGDWFNRLDFTYESNNWGVGLPPAGDNRDKWPIIQPLLANSALKPGRAEILSTLAHFEEMLRIRRSSPLFRLRTAEDILRRVTFRNTGPDAIPGVIVMDLTDAAESKLDPNYDRLVVVFNARPEPVAFTDEAYRDLAFALHPVQQASQDAVVQQAHFETTTGTFNVPARTTAVFVLVAARGTAGGPASVIAAVAVLLAAAAGGVYWWLRQRQG